MGKLLPSVWVLLGARAGDNAQALELARQLGGRTEGKHLIFNRLSALPNMLLGAGFKTLAAGPEMSPPWPDVVIATARRAAPISLAIKSASGGQTIAVHIGRPRMPLARFDLVLATAQYGLPEAHNVIQLLFPFARAKSVPVDVLEGYAKIWSHLPRPWHVGVIGAAKFPLRLGVAEQDAFAAGLNSLVEHRGGSIILMDSPRSEKGAIARIGAKIRCRHWLWNRNEGANPYQAALSLADHFAVTSDSVSMVSEMVQTGKPVQVFHLPQAEFLPRWSAKTGVGSAFARWGILSPPRNVAHFLSTLSDRGWIGDLKSATLPKRPFQATDEHSDAAAKIIALWQKRATD